MLEHTFNRPLISYSDSARASPLWYSNPGRNTLAGLSYSWAFSALICLKQVSLKNSMVRDLPESQTVALVPVQLTLVSLANDPMSQCSH